MFVKCLKKYNIWFALKYILLKYIISVNKYTKVYYFFLQALLSAFTVALFYFPAVCDQILDHDPLANHQNS